MHRKLDTNCSMVISGRSSCWLSLWLNHKAWLLLLQEGRLVLRGAKGVLAAQLLGTRSI